MSEQKQKGDQPLLSHDSIVNGEEAEIQNSTR